MRDSYGTDSPTEAGRSRDPGTPRMRLADAILEGLGDERRREKRVLRWAVAIALLFHGVMFSLTFSSHGTTPSHVTREQKVFVLQQPRFKPPPPSGQPKPPEKRKKKIPIPDPTPDDPEPIVDPEIVTPEIEPDLDDLVLGIPEAPPAAFGSPSGLGEGPFQVGGDIHPPEKIHAPQPAYTEEARKARIQGTVILMTTIDVHGNVTHMKILKGLPEGLTESAARTVAGWRFKPATKNGTPVPVYFHLSVRFSLM
ncbi:MAG: energy transducer TonB [bacterium]|nr:energy transducer TonB [bacterium]